MDLNFDSEDDGSDDWPEREEDMVLLRVSPLMTVWVCSRVERGTRGLPVVCLS